MIENICNNKAINTLIYLQSISKIIDLISAILIIVLLINFIVKIKRYYKLHILIKKIIKVLFLILLIILIPLSIYYLKNNISIEDLCLEQEEKETINNYNIKPSQDISLNDSLTEELRENYFYFLDVGAATEAFIIEDQGHFGLIDTSYESSASYILR